MYEVTVTREDHVMKVQPSHLYTATMYLSEVTHWAACLESRVSPVVFQILGLIVFIFVLGPLNSD